MDDRVLPPPLRERLRSGATTTNPLPAPRDGKAFVLYALRTCYRSRGNPSLEVATRMATALDLPLLCIAVVEESLTDRAAAFRLEALKELQPIFAQRGASLLVHVDREGCRMAVAMSLAAKAALVISDEHYGVEPHAAACARIAKTGAPLWLCDAHCTLPSRLLDGSALVGGNAGFLSKTQKERTRRLSDASWLPPPAAPPERVPPAAPAWAIDLNDDDATRKMMTSAEEDQQPSGDAIDIILAAPSKRDATVGRLRHTRGGPSAASARWAAYVKGGGLKQYASHRNNPLAPDGKGASRMSCYVNSGMIDAYVMARDALAAKADKYLSEFVGFRESAHLWCLLHPGGYANANVAVPVWARGQLRRFEDGRHDAGTPSLARLQAGQSGDALWDDCQRCLVLSGELHNNVRMAWGKAIPAWHAAKLPPPRLPSTSTASTYNAATRLQAALDLLILLNDKYALDGGAPPSYGGLLWCLGWRDRPGEGGCPTARPTSVMASRITAGDLERKARWRCSSGLATMMHAATSTLAVAPTPTTAEAAAAGSEAATAAPVEAARAEPPSKRQRAGAAGAGAGASGSPASSSGGSGGAGTLWHFLNRESAAALPPRGGASVHREG